MLIIPDSNTITKSKTTTVIIKCKNAIILYHNFLKLFFILAAPIPYMAKNISVVSVMTTTATISFSIPSIANTPEIYTIQYIGLIFQKVMSNSIDKQGTNTTATNVRYQIMLTGLEESNIYNFTVVSTNCIGSASSLRMNFTTLPASKFTNFNNYYFPLFLLFSTSFYSKKSYQHNLPST